MVNCDAEARTITTPTGKRSLSWPCGVPKLSRAGE
jgi:hypothetical protein